MKRQVSLIDSILWLLLYTLEQPLCALAWNESVYDKVQVLPRYTMLSNARTCRWLTSVSETIRKPPLFKKPKLR